MFRSLKAQSRSYFSHPNGVRTMRAYLLVREQVIKPLLAGAAHRLDRPPKVIHPLDQQYLNLRTEMSRTFETSSLAKYILTDLRLLARERSISLGA